MMISAQADDVFGRQFEIDDFLWRRAGAFVFFQSKEDGEIRKNIKPVGATLVAPTA
jgi:hypothetical protein